MTRNPYLSAKLQGFGTTIFAEMSALAIEHDAVNLGQGFPDFGPPEEIAQAAIDAIKAGHNQYAPSPGIPSLRQAIADHQSRFWELDYDPDTETTVTAGATEAICASLQALCDTGDEVVMFEPFYDSYQASVAMAGAVVRGVPLAAEGPDAPFSFDPDDLEHAIGPKTRLILLNNPHNPTGKVFTRAELELIARVCVEHDLVAVTDDVYEHLVFDGDYIPLSSLPGMKERTVLISSAGKSFSVTGWKIGWVCAPPLLTAAVRTAKQFMTFTNGTPFQHAVAEALRLDDAYFTSFVDDYRARRDRLSIGLQKAGFGVHPSQGTYFITVDIRPLGYEDDFEFCRLLPTKAGVVAIPTSVFYADARRAKHLVRFAYCKTDAVLDEGISRLVEGLS
jgi:N-succinyldiaminopimelate aminotransferase